jgi:hypothetical protein
MIFYSSSNLICVDAYDSSVLPLTFVCSVFLPGGMDNHRCARTVKYVMTSICYYAVSLSFLSGLFGSTIKFWNRSSYRHFLVMPPFFSSLARWFKTDQSCEKM